MMLRSRFWLTLSQVLLALGTPFYWVHRGLCSASSRAANRGLMASGHYDVIQREMARIRADLQAKMAKMESEDEP